METRSGQSHRGGGQIRFHGRGAARARPQEPRGGRKTITRRRPDDHRAVRRSRARTPRYHSRRRGRRRPHPRLDRVHPKRRLHVDGGRPQARLQHCRQHFAGLQGPHAIDAVHGRASQHGCHRRGKLHGHGDRAFARGRGPHHHRRRRAIRRRARDEDRQRPRRQPVFHPRRARREIAVPRATRLHGERARTRPEAHDHARARG